MYISPCGTRTSGRGRRDEHRATDETDSEGLGVQQRAHRRHAAALPRPQDVPPGCVQHYPDLLRERLVACPVHQEVPHHRQPRLAALELEEHDLAPRGFGRRGRFVHQCGTSAAPAPGRVPSGRGRRTRVVVAVRGAPAVERAARFGPPRLWHAAVVQRPPTQLTLVLRREREPRPCACLPVVADEEALRHLRTPGRANWSRVVRELRLLQISSYSDAP